MGGFGIATTAGAACARAVTPLMPPAIIAAPIAMNAASFVLYDHFMSDPPFIVERSTSVCPHRRPLSRVTRCQRLLIIYGGVRGLSRAMPPARADGLS